MKGLSIVWYFFVGFYFGTVKTAGYMNIDLSVSLHKQI